MGLWQHFQSRSDGSDAPNADDPPSGVLPRARRLRPLGCLGKYRLLELIGSGAMGAVYRAEHVVLGRIVAVKVLHAELANDESLVERFFAEARAVNLVGHPHIVDVTDFAREPDGTVWFVMEFLDGCDLAALTNGQALELGRALAIAQQVCAALQAVHAVGIVHRDIKPENIYVTTREGRDFVKLLDFGIARLPEAMPSEHGTGQGVVMGTPPYMAPEQACALAVDHRSDIYAVGAVLFGLITGSLLFRRNNIQALLEDVAFTPAPAPSAHACLPEAVRDDLDKLLARCLAKDPKDRPASASVLAAELAAIATRLDSGCEPLEAVVERRYQLALQQPAAEAMGQDADAALLARCRPKWQQRALWIAAALLLATGAARAAERFYPQLNQYRERATETLANVGGDKVNIIDGRNAPRVAPAPAAAAVRAPAPVVAQPPARPTPPHVSAVIQPPQLASTQAPAPSAQASETAQDQRPTTRTRSRHARSPDGEAVQEPASVRPPPVLTVAAAAEHPDPDLDPDKLLDPFATE
jgi:tRNA A-37 threonylcarbamoyl transferase component Bud32